MIGNLKLKSSNPDEIKFVIDHGNLINEIDETNNFAVINFDWDKSILHKKIKPTFAGLKK